MEERRAAAQPSSDIFVVRGTNVSYDGFKALIELMGKHELPFYKSEPLAGPKGPSGLIDRDDVVIVKVNSQWDERGGTNTDLVRSIIETILAHPDGFTGEVLVADNGQAQFGALGSGGSLEYERNNAEDTAQSVQAVVDTFSGARVSTYLWDRITTERVGEYAQGDVDDGYVVDDSPSPVTGIVVSYPKFRTRFGTYVSFKHGVWGPERGSYDGGRLKVINVPVLKAHRIYGVTACVKSYMGVASDKLTGRAAHRSVGRGGMGTQMAETRMPALNVLDAIWVNANPGTGPGTTYQEATRLNTIAASVDPVAMDCWASKRVLMQAARLKGHQELSIFDPDNAEPGSFGGWLRLSMEEIVKTGYRATADENRMNVYVSEL
ncbi:hypothetical protein AC482_01210 [miscellaneous Crenarchaeota group-15 archaeon DG-45]|uniref:DUF362 domain-containing protein n=1 Tax=miscellaneous Crenarchaeota group-15 archaeon DG-45 TaxID=1685127 RepID=A0A0M0BSA2_9ARCH|nr:MAG: hypothetical protein AC482_01210 [miscellaneous Crenarchaeota group-15 archaeon DG-45]